MVVRCLTCVNCLFSLLLQCALYVQQYPCGLVHSVWESHENVPLRPPAAGARFAEDPRCWTLGRTSHMLLPASDWAHQEHWRSLLPGWEQAPPGTLAGGPSLPPLALLNFLKLSRSLRLFHLNCLPSHSPSQESDLHCDLTVLPGSPGSLPIFPHRCLP